MPLRIALSISTIARRTRRACRLHYGLELFQRGHVVLCPDRFGHAERRRVIPNDLNSIDPDRDDKLLSHRVGQLLLRGRTSFGKEAYDLMRAADILTALPFVDADRLGVALRYRGDLRARN